MPYKTNSDLPENVRSVLPEAAQSIFREAFNSAMDGGKPEEDAMQTAWAALKNAGYEKTADGMWHLSTVGARRAAPLLASMVSTLRAIGDKGEADVKVLFDTGAGMSFVLRTVAEKLATLVKLPRPVRITLADGKTATTITDSVNLLIEAAGQQIMDTFIVLESALNDIILGESTMRKFGLKIDLERSVVFSALKTVADPSYGGSEIKSNLEDKSMWKKFLALLNITVVEEVTEEKAAELIKGKMAQPEVAQLAAAKTALTTLKSVVTILGLTETATEDEIKGKILVLRDRGDVVPRAEHEALLARVSEQEIEQVILAAMQGEQAKLTPAMKAGALQIAKDHGVATLKTYLGGLPKLGIYIKLPEKKPVPGAAQIDEVQAALNKQLGITQETFLKYNPAN